TYSCWPSPIASPRSRVSTTVSTTGVHLRHFDHVVRDRLPVPLFARGLARCGGDGVALVLLIADVVGEKDLARLVPGDIHDRALVLLRAIEATPGRAAEVVDDPLEDLRIAGRLVGALLRRAERRVEVLDRLRLCVTEEHPRHGTCEPCLRLLLLAPP